MLDRVEMNIVDMGREIVIAADRVFPKTALPEATLRLSQACIAAPLAKGHVAGERRLDDAPAGREVIVIGRQGPNAMEMIGKHDPGLDRERSAPAHQTNCVAQDINVSRQQVVAAPFEQVDREEITSTGHAVASVVGDGSFLRFGLRMLIDAAGHAAL